MSSMPLLSQAARWFIAGALIWFIASPTFAAQDSGLGGLSSPDRSKRLAAAMSLCKGAAPDRASAIVDLSKAVKSETDPEVRGYFIQAIFIQAFSVTVEDPAQVAEMRKLVSDHLLSDDDTMLATLRSPGLPRENLLRLMIAAESPVNVSYQRRLSGS